MSIRLGEQTIYTPGSNNIQLTLSNIPDNLQRGDVLDISGTGTPNGIVTIEIAVLGKEIIHSKLSKIDGNGVWGLDKPITIALDAKLDKYSIRVSDGNQNIMKQWNVISNKIIIVESLSEKYALGDLIKINGEAMPNIKLEIIIEDPLGKEIVSDIIQIDNSGYVKFEYKIEQTAIKGTYKIILNQENEREVMFVGVGQLPEIPVDLEFDKLNYLSNDIASITLIGKANEIINLLIIDPSDNQKGETISISLLEDGRYTHELDLTGYASGVYTAIISKGSTQNSEIFTVGLQIGSGNIQIQTTKTNYMPGESILILGETSENSLLEITLLDSKENKIKTKQSFSNKEGKIVDNTFRIPTDAIPGIWKIGVKSGSNFDQVEINIISNKKQGIQLIIQEGIEIVGVGESIQIKMTGVEQNVEIKIISSNNEIIDTLTFPPSEQGEIDVPWIIPKDLNPGTYTIIAKDAFNSVEETFEVS